MKALVGKQVTLLVQGFPGPVKGAVLKDMKDRVFLAGDDGIPTTIIKSKICGWKVMDGKVNEPLFVLHCENPAIKCPGVHYFQRKNVRQADFDIFMNPCPCKREDCQRVDLGDLGVISREVTCEVLHGTFVGDYPDETEEE
jgi:hypothetical protein